MVGVLYERDVQLSEKTQIATVYYKKSWLLVVGLRKISHKPIEKQRRRQEARRKKEEKKMQCDHTHNNHRYTGTCIITTTSSIFAYKKRQCRGMAGIKGKE